MLGFESVIQITESPVTFWVLFILFIWMVGGLLHKTVKARFVEPRLIFSAPYVQRVGFAPDTGDKELMKTKIKQDMISIKVKNAPINSQHGHDLERAWTRLCVYSTNTGQHIITVDNCRWGENQKPRKDYHAAGDSTRFKEEWNRRTIFANQQWNTINFGLRPLFETVVYGLSAQDQERENYKTEPYTDWVNPNHKIASKDFFVIIKVFGTGANVPAQACLHIIVTDDVTNPDSGIIVTPLSYKEFWTTLKWLRGEYG